MNTKSFTLIELLIVIVIVSILSISLIPKVKNMQKQAKIRVANKDLQDFNTALMVARVYDFKILKEITRSGCSDCACRNDSVYPNGPTYLIDLPYDHPCKANRRNVLERVAVAAQMESGALMYMELDPRGSPYQLDENEGEYSYDYCRNDSLFSVGPDGKRGGGDNIVLSSKPVFCPGAY